jgi:hypothetical protein
MMLEPSGDDVLYAVTMHRGKDGGIIGLGTSGSEHNFVGQTGNSCPALLNSLPGLPPLCMV